MVDFSFFTDESASTDIDVIANHDIVVADNFGANTTESSNTYPLPKLCTWVHYSCRMHTDGTFIIAVAEIEPEF